MTTLQRSYYWDPVVAASLLDPPSWAGDPAHNGPGPACSTDLQKTNVTWNFAPKRILKC